MKHFEMRILALGGTRHITSMLVAGLVGVGLAVTTPTSAVAVHRQLPAAEYARAVCAPMREVKSIEDYIAPRAAPANFAASQQQAIDFMTEYQQVWANAAATLEATSPNVRNGARIGRLFADYATTAAAGIQKAVDAFKAVDPASGQYMNARRTLGMAALTSRAQLGDPLEMVTDRSVLRAFSREKTCADLFPSVIDPEGHFTEFPATSSFPFAMAEHPDPDGNLWFTALLANKIVKIDPAAGVLTEFPGPAGFPTTTSITVGPDGNLWFTVRNGNAPLASAASATAQIGKFDPATGVATLIPTPNAYPNGITTGPDGSLWFADARGNQVGKIDPATGAVTVSIPTAGASPGRIVAGPDGSLWFTDTNANKIGRINPVTRVVTVFPVPTVGEMYGMTAGPDGNVWFAQRTSNRIGKIDPEGHFTMFPIPTTASGLLGITAGCDGDLWFTENNLNKIGRIDARTGTVTEFLIPTPNAQPAYIAAVSDGSVWFTAEITNSVWKLDPGAVGRKKDGKILQACLKPPTFSPPRNTGTQRHRG